MRHSLGIQSGVLSFCVIIILGTVANSVVAQERTVGVSTEDAFEYGVAFSWSTSDPSAPIPDPYKSISETERMSILVVDVSDASVTVRMTQHFENGSETTQAGATDVDTGTGNMTYWLVSANLVVNDTVFTSGVYSKWRINETIVRTYQTSTRNTNHVNLTVEGNMNSDYEYVSTNIYWDQDTGIMVEMQAAAVFRLDGVEANMTTSIVMTQSNAWVVPEFSKLTFALMLTIMTIVALVSRKRRPGKTEIA